MVNRKAIVPILSLFLIGICNTASANLSTQPVVYRSGVWEVRKSVDPMTDKVTCTGVYGKEFGYQVTDDSLFLRVRGGVKSVTLRYGNNQPERLRLPSSMEEKMNFIILEGGEFRKLLSVNRLRTQALTYIRGIDSKDINITGINDVVTFIKSGCKSTPSSRPQSSSSVKPSVQGEHMHGDRSHSHPLPAQGVKHRHGNGEIGR